MSIELHHITKTFGKFVALQDINLTIQTGELVALLGPSGSGKTTLLRIIAGLEFSDNTDARILFGKTEVTRQSAYQRRAGFVFQHYALFQHMTVFDNVAFSLTVLPRCFRPKKSEIEERVHTLLRLVHLESLAKRLPSQLSGGQRQRVALARALAIKPRVLLLDEPFGALDAKVRKELRKWLRQFHDQTQLTTLFVTHDQEEALELADRVVILNNGIIEQIGTPKGIYDSPATPFVCSFLGEVNQLQGEVEKGYGELAGTRFEISQVTEVDRQTGIFYIRPDEIELSRQRNGTSVLEAKVLDIQEVGCFVRVGLRLNGGEELLEAVISRSKLNELQLRQEDQIYIKPQNIRFFPVNS